MNSFTRSFNKCLPTAHQMPVTLPGNGVHQGHKVWKEQLQETIEEQILLGERSQPKKLKTQAHGSQYHFISLPSQAEYTQCKIFQSSDHHLEIQLQDTYGELPPNTAGSREPYPWVLSSTSPSFSASHLNTSLFTRTNNYWFGDSVSL